MCLQGFKPGLSGLHPTLLHEDSVLNRYPTTQVTGNIPIVLSGRQLSDIKPRSSAGLLSSLSLEH